MVRHTLILSGLAFSIVFNACKKDDNSITDCFPNTIIVRQLINKQATIKWVVGKYYIVEQGVIDTRLNPCNLTQEFQVDNLQVIVSGDVKSTVQPGPGPCCGENFVITKITK